MPLQWFPGHMTKAVRQIKENLSRADIVIEVLDARIPLSSRNPMIDDIVGKMPRLIVLNKADLADPNILAQWEKALTGDNPNIQVVQISAKTGKNLPQLIEKAKYLCRNASWAGRRAVRAMVLGVPNVGKSAIINYLSGRRSRNVENRPGVTRDVSQSIKISASLKVIDTPGILWHKFEDQAVGEKLAVLGSINDEILFREDIAVKALEYFYQFYPKKLQERFNLAPEEISDSDLYKLLETIGKKRGCLLPGGKVDTEKAARIILTEVRDGRICRFCLERPESASL
ncbi:MAG: ribosome biogenesis GTPase YlqF [Spirochaetales bacterium]|nr:ribosome biogenesis GTPase YlqF [Spirochaetales bacterium]